ncbi:MAG: hypothetical protein ABSB71_12325 [Candidatus Bathyarchaeia archaeon]|jgi:hypothetical protein
MRVSSLDLSAYFKRLSESFAGTAVTIIIGPNGTTTGKPKYTFTGCIITKLDLKWDQKSAVSNSFAAKGILSAVGSFT